MKLVVVVVAGPWKMAFYEICLLWVMLLAVGARASSEFRSGEEKRIIEHFPFRKDAAVKDGPISCEEVKGKSEGVTCYRCKNLRNGSTHERCSDQRKIRDRRSRPPYFRAHETSKPQDPYRFSEEFFSGASHEIPAEYKRETEKCEKVIENSMVCLVCEDAKTNGKYKQCSYVAQPSESSESPQPFESAQVKRQQDESEDDCTIRRKSGQTCRVCKDRKTGGTNENCMHVYPEKKKAYSYSSSGGYDGGRAVAPSGQLYAEEESSASTADCRKVEKNGQTCMICKSAENAGEYERCSYSSVPNDRLYKFTKSKSYGKPQPSSGGDEYGSSYKYPREEESSAGSDRDSVGRGYEAPKSEVRSSYQPYTKSRYDDADSYGFADYKSASEKAAGSISPGNCEKIERDGMTCTVCKDPKTGGNSEQCSYAFRPKDKLFSYSKSRSIGSPTKTSDSDDEESYGHVAESKPGLSVHARRSAAPSVASAADNPVPDKLEKGFFDASEKKAEIDKFLQEFRQEDRRKCEKVLRDKMSCYRCIDKQGYQKEECVFVGAVEPAVAASGDAYSVAKREKPGNPGKSGSHEENGEEGDAEAYEYALETRPVYDETLGLTLPEYMLTPSEHEKAFDEAVASFHKH